MKPTRFATLPAHLARPNLAGVNARDGFAFGEGFFGYYFYFSQILRAGQDAV
jgi:hypothetical protein